MATARNLTVAVNMSWQPMADQSFHIEGGWWTRDKGGPWKFVSDADAASRFAEVMHESLAKLRRTRGMAA